LHIIFSDGYIAFLQAVHADVPVIVVNLVGGKEIVKGRGAHNEVLEEGMFLQVEVYEGVRDEGCSVAMCRHGSVEAVVDVESGKQGRLQPGKVRNWAGIVGINAMAEEFSHPGKGG
jgi:hypothetical protein